jgi:Domain of unknown function (DUF309)
MTKGQRISRLVTELEGETPGEASTDISHHPFYRGFFRCWNEQRYYEAHDVLEHLWQKTKNEDANYFKGLIQAAGAFVHLQKQFQYPSHAKHGRRLQPAVRLFRLAQGNLAPFVSVRHSFDVAGFRDLLGEYAERILASEYRTNPWSPSSAPKLQLILKRAIQPSSERDVR